MNLQTSGLADILAAIAAKDQGTARTTLIAEVRAAHAEAVESGDLPADSPIAATFTREELDERGIGVLRASRKGNGPVQMARTLDDGTVLVVLNPDTGSDDEDETAE